MSNHYILVNGPYDQVFIGPFDSFDAAESYVGEMRDAHPDFGFLAITENEMQSNVAEFGALAIETPDDWKPEREVNNARE